MDVLLAALANVSRQLLPVLGCLVLIFLVVMISRVIKLLKDLSVSLDKVNKTIDNVDESLKQLQVPINTIVTISHTVDLVHAYSTKVAKETIDYIISYIALIKDWLMQLMHKKQSTEENTIIKDEEESFND